MGVSLVTKQIRHLLTTSKNCVRKGKSATMILMLRIDEIIALNVLKFAERWRLQPWVDIRWDNESGKFVTILLTAPSDDSDGEDTECEVSSLEELNLLLASDIEFYRNVTTLVSIGAVESHDVKVEPLVEVISDRIRGVEASAPYPYSMVTGNFSPSEDYIYQFSEKEIETGRIALDAIRVLSRTGDWWGETLLVRHVDKEWSSAAKAYVPAAEKHFSVRISANDVYRFACHESVELNRENFHLLETCVDDVLDTASVALADEYGVTRSFWASVLFCERSGEVNDELMSAAMSRMPERVAALFPLREVSLL